MAIGIKVSDLPLTDLIDGDVNIHVIKTVDFVPTSYRTTVDNLLYPNSITNQQIAENAITVAKIADDAVTAGKIAADAVNETHIAALAVNADAIAENAVSTDKIAADAITSNKIAAGAVTATEILAGTITSDEIAANTIKSENILAGAITATEIGANAITSANIAAGSIVASDIGTGTMSSSVISLNTVNGRIQSLNYNGPSKTGFRIRGNGDAEFNDVTVRGTLKNSKIIVDDEVNLYRTDAPTKPAKPTIRARGYKNTATVYAPNHTSSNAGVVYYVSPVKIYGRNATGATIDNRFLCDGNNKLTLDITANVHYYSNTTGVIPEAPRLAISDNNGLNYNYYNITSGQQAVQFDESMRDFDYEGFDPNPTADAHLRMQWAWRKGRLELSNVAANAILTIAVKIFPRWDNTLPIASYRNINLDVQVSNWN